MGKPKRTVTVRMSPELYVALQKETGQQEQEKEQYVSMESVVCQAIRDTITKGAKR